MFDIGILIQHPSIDPDKITAGLCAKPTSMCRSGDRVVTPKGRETGDRHRWTSWSYFESDDSLSSNEKIRLILKKIQDAASLISIVSKEGGKATLIIRHDSSDYANCELNPEALTLLARLSVTVGFEVFAE